MGRTLLLLSFVSLSIWADPVTYKYDAAGRLVTADYGSAGVITYTYDKAGNLTNRTVTVPPGPGGASPSVQPKPSDGVNREDAPDPVPVKSSKHVKAVRTPVYHKGALSGDTARY